MRSSGRAILIGLASLAVSACAGPGVHVSHDRTVEAHSEGRALSYRYGPVPAEWRPIEIQGNDVAWFDASSHGVVHIDHSCAQEQDVPLPSLVQHLLISFTDREFVSEETIPFDGREARHTVVRARLDGVPTMLDLYVLKKDGCVFDLGFVAPPDHFDSGETGFRAFAAGFATVNTGMASAQPQGHGS